MSTSARKNHHLTPIFLLGWQQQQKGSVLACKICTYKNIKSSVKFNEVTNSIRVKFNLCLESYIFLVPRKIKLSGSKHADAGIDFY